MKLSRKVISVLMAMVILLSVFSISAFADGDSTMEITTVEELDAILSNPEDYQGKSIAIMNDLDMSEYGFYPVDLDLGSCTLYSHNYAMVTGLDYLEVFKIYAVKVGDKYLPYQCNGEVKYSGCAFCKDDSKWCHFEGGVFQEYCNHDVEMNRLEGRNRYFTSTAVADELKKVFGLDKFQTIIVATGTDFADALSGSYLAIMCGAPILLVNEKSPAAVDNVVSYIKDNLDDTGYGKVYILGGEGVISNNLVQEFKAVAPTAKFERLAGSNRYRTNIAILNEIGVGGDDIVVVDGSNFADALSVSATGKAIFLANTAADKLLDYQKEFLDGEVGPKGSDIDVIGGTGAVSDKIANEMVPYDIDAKTERIAGANRYRTSTEIASAYFDNTINTIVLATGSDYADGLCAGPLAYYFGAPLILSTSKTAQVSVANEYMQDKNIANVTIIGGDGSDNLIKDQAAKDIIAKK